MSARPGDTVHVESYDTPPTGAPYLLAVVVKRSGGYVVVSEQLDGPKHRWYSGAAVGGGFKTVAGAVRAGQRVAREMEDVTAREGMDPLR